MTCPSFFAPFTEISSPHPILGFGEPIAMEGALKLKEIGYLHAEGYSGGALKHGPFAMIESDENGKQGATPIVSILNAV